MPKKHTTPKVPRYTPKRRRRGNPLTTDYEYDEDDLEFIAAVEKYKKAKGRKFPSFAELLGVAKSLGYKKFKEEDGK